jgi:predicted component of type VI protein secretion system
MKYIALFIAAIALTACSSKPPVQPTAYAPQPQVIVIHAQPATQPMIQMVPAANYWVPAPAARVYQQPAYVQE